MQFRNILPVLAMVLPATAVIIGITVPETITAGEPFDVALNIGLSIQSSYEVGVAFGISDGSKEGTLGTIVSSEYLGPEYNNRADPIIFSVTVEKDTAAGEAVFSASVFSLVGIDALPTLALYNSTVKVA